MTIEECYKQLGGDYSNVLSRLSNDAIIRKFLVKFLSDGSCGNIFTNLESGNLEEAFRAAHTLKGVAQNLGFDRLQKSASALTEAMSGAVPLTDESLFEEVCKDQKEIVEAIEKLD